MRKHLLLFAALICSLGMFAQSLGGARVVMPGGRPSNARVANPEFLQQFKRDMHASVHGGGRASTHKFIFDYDAVDNDYATLNTQDYKTSLWSCNRRFPNDSSFTNRWAAVLYDTIFDFSTNTTFPYDHPPMSSVQLNLDTLRVLYAHVKNITTPGRRDTIVVTVYDMDTVTTIGMNGISSQILFTDTLYVDSTLTGVGTTPGTFRTGTLTFTPGLTLPRGKRFAMQLDFYGPVEDDFFFLAGYRDGCAAACAGMNSIVPSTFGPGTNSFSYFIYKNGTTAFQTYNHFVTIDCNANSTIEDNLCENFYIQNIWAFPYVTANENLSASVSTDKTGGCPGETVNITLGVYGGTGASTISWTPTGGLDNPASATPVATVADSSITYTATMINGTDTTHATVLIRSNGITVNAGADRSIACGTTTNLNASIRGVVTGATYAWSNGRTTAANAGVVAGNYTVTVTNSAGCTATDAVAVTYPGISQTVNFSVPSPICVNKAATFPNTSAKTTGWSFVWTEVVSGTTYFTTNAVITVAAAGPNSIKLDADSGGCTFSITKPITVRASADPLCRGGIGINEVNFSENVSIFPNPTSGTFQLNVYGGEETLSVMIYDLSGKVIYTENAKGGAVYNKEIDLSKYASGVYYVKVQSGNNIAVKKVALN